MPLYEIFNADGSLKVDLASRIPRVLGVITIGAAGSLSDPGFATGVLFYTLNPAPGSYTLNGYPNVSLSGTTLSWGAPTASLLLTYGVY